MNTTIGIIGIVIALAFMTYAVYKNWSILYCSIISAIIIGITNGMDLTVLLTNEYIRGMSEFAAPNMILFIEGAMLGKLYDDSGAAWRLGTTVVNKVGKRFAILGYILVVSILEYGGISTFVICFVLLPLARPIFKATGTPWYMWTAYTLIGLVPPELMFPGGLQTHNILPTTVLGTTLTAAPVMGIVMAIVYYVFCFLYIKIENKRAKNCEWKMNSLPPEVTEKDTSTLEASAPHVIISIVPIVASLVLINVIGLPVIVGMGIGVIVAALLFFKSIGKENMLNTLNTGAKDGVMPLVMVAAVVGIAKVVSVSPSFGAIQEMMLGISSGSKITTGLSVVGITNIISLICGSASGSIAMTCEMFGEAWMNLGLSAEWIHRTVCAAAGGFDTVPWNSFVVLMLSMAGLSYKKGYGPVFWTSLVAPIVAAMACVAFI